jgi:hypothetical protein
MGLDHFEDLQQQINKINLRLKYTDIGFVLIGLYIVLTAAGVL